jgi:hypothetical protein
MKTIEKVLDVNAHIKDLQYEVFCDDGIYAARIRFTNLAYGTITDIRFSAQGCNKFGDVVLVNGREKFFLVLQDINIGKNSDAINMKAALPSDDIRSLVLEESQIHFTDGSVVTYEGKQEYTVELEIFSPIDEIEKEQAAALKYKFGHEFKYKAKEIEVAWICGCGCVNKADSDVCMSCNTKKTDAFAAFKEETLNSIVTEYRVAEENRKEAERNEVQKIKNKKEHIKNLIINGIIFAIFACIIGFFVVMAGRRIYDNEDYMRDDLQGTYTYYDKAGAPLRQLKVYGDELIYISKYLGEYITHDITWYPTRGQFATFDTYTVTKNGDIKDGNMLYKKGGYMTIEEDSDY